MKASKLAITQLLHQWREGDDEAMEQLAPLVFQELHHRARGYLQRERKNHTLSPTALVNEAYVHLYGERDREWRNRLHFFAIAAKIMKHLLIQYAQARNAQKRGGGQLLITLEQVDEPGYIQPQALISLGEGLKELEKLDQRKAWIVEMHYFAGMAQDEVAKVLDISHSTVKRELKFSRAWLRRYLKGK